MGNAGFSEDFKRDAVHPLSDSGLPANHEKKISVRGYPVTTRCKSGLWLSVRQSTQKSTQCTVGASQRQWNLQKRAQPIARSNRLQDTERSRWFRNIAGRQIRVGCQSGGSSAVHQNRTKTKRNVKLEKHMEKHGKQEAGAMNLNLNNFNEIKMVPEVGLEPTSLAAGDFESLVKRLVTNT